MENATGRADRQLPHGRQRDGSHGLGSSAVPPKRSMSRHPTAMRSLTLPLPLLHHQHSQILLSLDSQCGDGADRRSALRSCAMAHSLLWRAQTSRSPTRALSSVTSQPQPVSHTQSREWHTSRRHCRASPHCSCQTLHSHRHRLDHRHRHAAPHLCCTHSRDMRRPCAHQARLQQLQLQQPQSLPVLLPAPPPPRSAALRAIPTSCWRTSSATGSARSAARRVRSARRSPRRWMKECTKIWLKCGGLEVRTYNYRTTASRGRL